MTNSNYIHVSRNEFKVTDDVDHIIGCNSLIYCFGILLYSEKYKIAVATHKGLEGDIYAFGIKEEHSNLIEKLDYKLKQAIIARNGEFSDDEIKYLLIPPAMYSNKTSDNLNFCEYLLEKKYLPFSDEELKEGYIVTVQVEKGSFVNCFAFDASVGTFVTEQIFKEDNIIAKFNKKGRK